MLKRVFCLIIIAALAALGLAACAGSDGYKALDREKALAAVEKLGVFPAAMQPDDAMLESVYGLDVSLIKDRLIGVPLMNVHASMYWLLLAEDEDAAAALDIQMEAYFKSYQELWDSYLPEQAKLVRERLKARYETEEGVWLLYIISSDNEAVRQAVEGALE
ncbi:MAG: DUF4358 domain-containing protein [Oscillospiraceae bacterium]|nr:DUF4358 domain-containing protein [Oscillospiraceae bacterium]